MVNIPADNFLEDNGPCSSQWFGRTAQIPAGAFSDFQVLGTALAEKHEALTRTSQLPVKEREFTATVLDIFQMCGWKTAHIAQSRREVVTVDEHTGEKQARWVGDSGTEGYPDLTVATDKPIKYGDGFGLYFLELKVGKNKPTKAQQGWLDVLNGALPGHALVLYPENIELIKRIAGTR